MPQLRPVFSRQNFIVKRNNVPLCAPISFNLKAGGLLLLTGENGTGKSTALKQWAGLLGDQPLAKDCAYHGHKVAISTVLTVAEQLAFYQKLQGSHIDNIPDNFTPALEQKICYLSAGQKQRLALARLWYCQHKPLWLLDEPLTALDKTSQKIFLELCKNYTKQGGCIIAAVHDTEIWKTYWPEHQAINLVATETVTDDSWF